MSSIKSKFIANKTERLLKKKEKTDSLKVDSVVKTIGIIVTEGSDFNFELLKKLQKNIGISSNNFHVLTCKKTNESHNEFRGVVFFEKDFSWTGSLKSKEVKDFLDTNFDMLIDYTSANTIFKKYLVAKAKAQFKVGYANVDNRLYDLMIAVENEEIITFNKELLKYLKILKKL